MFSHVFKSNPTGINQYSKGSGGMGYTPKAQAAASATSLANKSGKPEDHLTAFEAQRSASHEANKRGDKRGATLHSKQAQTHYAASRTAPSKKGEHMFAKVLKSNPKGINQYSKGGGTGAIGDHEKETYGAYFPKGTEVKDNYGKKHKVISHVGPEVLTTGGNFHPTKLHPLPVSALAKKSDPSLPNDLGLVLR